MRYLLFMGMMACSSAPPTVGTSCVVDNDAGHREATCGIHRWQWFDGDGGNHSCGQACPYDSECQFLISGPKGTCQ